MDSIAKMICEKKTLWITSEISPICPDPESYEVVQWAKQLFDDFVPEKANEVVLGERSIMLRCSDVGVILLLLTGIAKTKSRANEIKNLLKGKQDLFWLYAAAQRDTVVAKNSAAERIERMLRIRKLLGSISRANCNQDEVLNSPELKEFDKTLQKEGIKGIALQMTTLEKDKREHTERYGKDARRSSSPILRAVIREVVNILCFSEASDEVPLNRTAERGFDREAIKQWISAQSLKGETLTLKNASAAIFAHLALFGIYLKSPRSVLDIYYAHRI